MVPLVKVMEVPPVSALSTAEEPQLLCVAGEELLIVTSAGRLSTMEKFVRSVSAGAEMVIRNREFSPERIVVGENDFLAETPLPAA